MGLMTPEMRRLLEVMLSRDAASDMIWRRAQANLAEAGGRESRQSSDEVTDLRLVTLALTELLIEKGILSEDEIKDRLRRVVAAETKATVPVEKPAPPPEKPKSTYIRHGRRRRLGK